MKTRSKQERNGARTPLVQVVAANMRRRRRSLGLSRNQIAERSGMSPDTLSRMEKGTARVTLIDIEKVARALGMSSSDLVRRGRKRVG